ncbi:MAG: hypothetical protein J6Y44_01825 [Clostridia bacterium]|nr:hypothetical protein [Clostridia bacterium]
MIRLICGPKGTGKTKTILESVNACVDGAKGDIVFITPKKFDTLRLSFDVRVIYTDDFGICGAEQTRGFIKGLFAGNADIEYVYIDGLLRIIGNDSDLTDFFKDLIDLEREYGFKAVITLSKDKKELPEFVQGFVE